MLAVVVDDHDMGVTHVIRGDDHLNNAARQMKIYQAMGWDVPVWAHIPLIHGPDGKKLSKRHGALGVEEYQAMGYPAAAMRNYLARLGWSHGDDEFFTDEQAHGVVRPRRNRQKRRRGSTSRNWRICRGQHIAVSDDAALQQEIVAFLAAARSARPDTTSVRAACTHAMYCLKERAKIMPELLEKAHFVLVDRPIAPDEKAAAALDGVSRGILRELTPHLQNASWTKRHAWRTILTGFAEAQGTKFGKLAGPLRAALAGRAVTPRSST